MTARCHYCGARATTQDHIIPKALGGVSARYNLVPSCRACNQEKGDRMPTCGCDKCILALVLPRRAAGQQAIRRAAEATAHVGPPRKSRQRRRRGTRSKGRR